MKSPAALAAVLLLSASPAIAQNPGTETDTTSGKTYGEDAKGHPAYWQAELSGGHYMVKLGSIISASRHEYIADGVARVVEVNVATSASVVARFYFVEAAGKNSALNVPGIVAKRVESTTRELGGRAGVDTDTTVVKNYPASTHAHTVEFRVPNLGTLDSLYGSLTSTMQDGKGRVWRQR